MPDIELFTFIPNTSAELSSLFVVLLWCVAGIFLFFSTLAFFKAKSRINKLTNLLKNTSIDTLADERLSFIDNIKDSKHKNVSHLWQEFDETLIEIVGHDGVTRLHNTFDASYFFNSSTLAHGSTESRMLAAVPGFLTALGVLGTFVGLQLGLSDLNISSNVDVNQMKDGVAGVINGAKIAFITSVWGVLLSLLFNFFEKVYEYFIRSYISKLQQRIDQLFPRLSTESQLERIARDSHQSRESLQGLAEQIGDRLQDSLIQATQGIQHGLEASLEKIMAPAINKLVNETSDGNQKALESVLTAFMDGFGEQGKQQRLAMDQASSGVNTSLDKMSKSMEAFLNRLQLQQDASSEREKDLISQISIQVSELVEQGHEQKRTLSELLDKQVTAFENQLGEREKSAVEREEKWTTSMNTMIKDLVDSVSNQSQALNDLVNQQIRDLTHNVNQRDQKTREVFITQTDAMKQGTTTLLSRISEVSEATIKAAENVLTQGKQLQGSLDSSITASARATESMQQSAKELRSASDNMQVFGSHIREAGNNLSGAVKQAVDSTKDLAQQNQQSSIKIEQLHNQLLENTARFEAIAKALDGAVSHVGNTFNTLEKTQSQFLQAQKQALSELSSDVHDKVSRLNEQMTKLLEDYATQANSQTAAHLKVWSSSVTDYAANMNKAVNALSNVVDEIQDKVS